MCLSINFKSYQEIQLGGGQIEVLKCRGAYTKIIIVYMYIVIYRTSILYSKIRGAKISLGGVNAPPP